MRMAACWQRYRPVASGRSVYVELGCRAASVAVRMVRIRYMRMRMSQWLMAMPVAVRTGRHCVMSVVVMSVVVAKNRQFQRASLIVVASVARVNRRFAVARGGGAHW